MPELGLWTLLAGIATLGAPILLAAMGGLMSERAGVMNIALEGKMLTAACVGALVGARFENAWMGLAAAIGSAIIMSIAHGLLTQGLRLDHIVSGMALNAIAIGGTNFLDKGFSDLDRVGEVPTLPVPVFATLSILCAVIIWWMLRKTAPGLHLLAVGEDPSKSRQMGLNPIRIRYLALIATGVLCGLAGAMILSNTGRFTDGMTAGRGYIALAALILGGWRPLPTLVACAVFGFFEAFQLRQQGSLLFGFDLPSEAWNSLPYVATLVAMAGFLGRTKPPAGLGKP